MTDRKVNTKLFILRKHKEKTFLNLPKKDQSERYRNKKYRSFYIIDLNINRPQLLTLLGE